MKSFDLLKMDIIHVSRVWIRKTGLVEKMLRSNKKSSKIFKLILSLSKILALFRIKLRLSLKRQKNLLVKSSFRFFFKRTRLSISSTTKILS